jgi:TldD protein
MRALCPAQAAIVLVALTPLACARTNQRASAPPAPTSPATTAAGPRERRPDPPRFTRVDPLAGGGAPKATGLGALERELARAMAALGKVKPAPYFISYQVRDRADIEMKAVNGALVRALPQHRRVLATDVRVGDHSFDSSRPASSIASVDSPPVSLPLVDDEAVLQAIAWRETDRAYKGAADRYAQLRAQRAVKVERDATFDDLSREQPVQFLEPTHPLAVDQPAWEDRLRRLSARFRKAPDIARNEITFSARSEVQWTVTSEGTLVQTGRNAAFVSITATTRADDGSDLSRSRDFGAASIDRLPDDQALGAAVDQVIADVQALRRAPVAEPYAAPAIFAGPAAAVLFHEAFGHRAEAFRLREADDGQTFAKKIGEAVMPAFLSVYDDPTLQALGEIELNGFYRFDQEGMPAQRASLVENGVLKGFLLGRAPVQGFAHSNGHGRSQFGIARADARMANLVVQPAVVVPAAELRRRLLAEVARQDRRYGFLFDDIAGGFTTTGRGSGRLAVKLVVIYRVWPDGRPDELVRGADLAGTPLTVLNKVLAAADTPAVFNGGCGARSGWVGQANISPAVLVSEVEIERKAKGQDKPPVLPPPPLASATGGAP